MLVNTKTDGMKYEVTGKQNVSDPRAVSNKVYRKAVNQHSTIYTLWLLAVKHKVGLLAIGNIILVLNWALPEWPQLLMGIIGK